MMELREGDYTVFIWDMYENANGRSLFYKKLSGYKTRKYGQVIDENEAVLKRLQGYDLEKPENIPSETLPPKIDGISANRKLYTEYEYEGVLQKIPENEKIRLNDSAYMIYTESAPLIRQLLEQFENIVKSLYELHLNWEEIKGIKAEEEADLEFSAGAEQIQQREVEIA